MVIVNGGGGVGEGASSCGGGNGQTGLSLGSMGLLFAMHSLTHSRDKYE